MAVFDKILVYSGVIRVGPILGIRPAGHVIKLTPFIRNLEFTSKTIFCVF